MPAPVAGMLEHWERSLVEIGFLDPEAPKKLMPRLQQLFNRAQPTPEEIHILRGIAKAMLTASRQRQNPRACTTETSDRLRVPYRYTPDVFAPAFRHPVHPRPRPGRAQHAGKC